MTRPLRVGFTGYYGMRNFGDDLFGVLCAMAARRYWDADPVLVGPALVGPGGTSMGVASTVPERFPVALYGASGPAGKFSRLLSFLRGVHGTDVMVMGGGSVITARDSFRKPMLLSAQRRRRLQVAAVGVSIGPFADAASQSVVAEYAKNFSYIAVRDQRSFDLALRMGLEEVTHRGCDLAGLLPVLAPMQARRIDNGGDVGPLRIGIAPCAYAPRSDHPAPPRDAWQDAMIEAIARVSAASARQAGPLQVDVFSLNGHPTHGDEALAEDLQSRLRERGIAATLRAYRGRDPLATVREIGRCDAFISARLHGAIVAYMCGVPFTLVEYHPKCRDFADDVGLPRVLRITSERHGVETLTAAVAAMLNDGGTPPRVSPDIYAREAEKIFQYAPWSKPAPHHES